MAILTIVAHRNFDADEGCVSGVMNNVGCLDGVVRCAVAVAAQDLVVWERATIRSPFIGLPSSPWEQQIKNIRCNLLPIDTTTLLIADIQ